MKQFNNFKMIRNTFSILFCLVIYSTNAQIEPLLEPDYWTIEKIEIDGETTYADTDFFGDYDKLFFESNGTLHDLFYVVLMSEIIFDDSNQSFEIFNPTFIFGTPEGGVTDIAVLFMHSFCLEGEESPKNPFTYDFREEEDKIYLDITNNEGSVATFWTSTLSNTNFEEIEFSFYPNPVKNRLHIESAQAAIQQLEIVDMNGKQVLSTDFNNESIDVSHLSKGVYFLKITTKEGSTTKKFVKE